MSNYYTVGIKVGGMIITETQVKQIRWDTLAINLHDVLKVLTTSEAQTLSLDNQEDRMRLVELLANSGYKL